MKNLNIKDICEFHIKSKIKAGDGKKYGEYPFFTSSAILSKYLDSFQFETEGIIIGTGGNASIHYCSGRFAVSTDCLVISSKNKDILSEYLFLYLLKNIHIIENGFRGAGLKHISKKYIEDIEIKYIPHIEIQIKLIEAIKTSISLVNKRKEQIEVLDELIKSKFNEMFGIPKINSKEWEKDSIGNTIHSITAGWSANGEVREKRVGEKAVLKVSAVTKGYFKADEYKVLAKDTEIKKNIFPQKGDLLFSRANTREMVGATCIIKEDYPDLILPDKLWKVLFNNRVNVFYMKYVLSDTSIRAEFSAKSTGTSGSMYNVSMEKFKSIEIPVPPIEVQNQFADFVKQTDKLKFKMENSLKELEDNFNSLMQKAFKGELFN